MPITPADTAIPEEETPVSSMYAATEPSGDEEDTTTQDVAAADAADTDTDTEAPEGSDTAIPEGGAPSEDAKITRVADNSFSRPPPPPLIQYLPGMNADEKRLVDHLNTRTMREYDLDMKAVDRALTSRDAWARQDYRLQQSRKTRQELQDKSQQFKRAERLEHEKTVAGQIATQDKNIRERAKETYDRTPEGRAEKEYQSARQAGLNTQGTIKDDDEAVDAAARFLDLGAQKRFTENKGEFSKYGTNYTTNENAPNKEGLSDAYSKALDGVLNERQEVENNPRGDGSKGVDPYSAPQIKAMSNAEKRGMVGLITSIGVRNPSVSPDLITRAVLNVAYNTGVNNFGVDHKKGMFYVGGSGRIPGLSFSMSGDEFKQLIQLRKNTEAEEAQLRAAILNAQKSNSKPQ